MFYVYECLTPCVYVHHVCSDRGLQKGALDPLEQELQGTVSSSVGAGSWIWVLYKSKWHS